MDPHSRHSQFNHRAPKAGPPSRNIDSLLPNQRMEPNKMPNRKTSSSSSSAASTTLQIRRPIATNSRVKQDEMFKRDMYLSVVTNALHQKANGVSDTFDELVAQFNVPTSSSSNQPIQINTEQIRLWLLALSHVVSRLERTHSTLVDVIVNMPWTTFDSATVKSYTIFIGMLLSARPEYLSLVLTKIAHGFTYQSGIQALDAGMPSTSSSPLTRRVIYDRLHLLLRHILTLVPTLPSTLQPLLIRNFPHKRQNQVAQTVYIRNLLRVSEYCPELADKVLATIVDRAIQIDVEIQIELEELEEEEDVDEQDVFELDPFDVVLGQESSLTSDSDDDSDEDGGDNFSDLSSEAGDLDDFDLERHTEIPMNVKHIQEMVKKLDAILMLLFEHFERMRAIDGKAPDNVPMSPLELPPLPPLDGNALTPIDSRASSTQSSNLSSSTTQPTFTANISAASTSGAPQNSTVKTSLRSLFHSLLSIFDRIILRTFKSRYTQFLIFWFTSLDPEFADIFQGMLVERALMPLNGGLALQVPNNDNVYTDADTQESVSNSLAHTMTPELTRAAAASYIGSFVSRAKFVDREGTRRVVSVLCEYLRTHLDGVEADVRMGLGFGTGSVSSNTSAASTISAILASGQHSVFYAVTQAVFLIFCFRWRDLLGSDDYPEEDSYIELDLDLDGRSRKAPGKDKWMPELAVLKRVVSSILNPLKVCSSNVVMQFARIAQATDFVYCYTMLEMNKRNDMSFTSITSTTSTTTASRSRTESTSSSLTLLNAKVLYQPENSELNTFFPFDPYRLPKSNAFIQGVYREWSSVAIDEDDSDEDSEDSDEEVDQVSSDVDHRSSGLDIPRDNRFGGQKSDDDGGLGASLGAMSISPARMSISVGMRQ